MAVYLRRRWVQTWPHQFLREIALRYSWAAAVNLIFVSFTLVAGTAFAIVTAPDEYVVAGWIVLGILSFLAVLQLVGTSRSARDEAALRVDLLSSCLVLMHKHVFNSDEDFRFTLFIRDPVARIRMSEESLRWQEVFIPYVRRQSGSADYKVRDSRMYFPRNSNAGAMRTWDSAVSAMHRLTRGEFDFSTTKLPHFSNRKEMNDYFTEKLYIEPEVVERMSEYMQSVLQIWTLPLVDEEGVPKALLSIDCRRYFRFSTNSETSSSDGARTEEIGIPATDMEEAEVTINFDRFNTHLEVLRTLAVKVGVQS